MKVSTVFQQLLQLMSGIITSNNIRTPIDLRATMLFPPQNKPQCDYHRIYDDYHNQLTIALVMVSNSDHTWNYSKHIGIPIITCMFSTSFCYIIIRVILMYLISLYPGMNTAQFQLQNNANVYSHMQS